MGLIEERDVSACVEDVACDIDTELDSREDEIGNTLLLFVFV